MNEEMRLLGYADEFKDRAKKSQQMFQRARTHIIPEMEKKFQQFYRDQEEMDKFRHDHKFCMKSLIKDTIDGKID
jgi:hypothetical protein